MLAFYAFGKSPQQPFKMPTTDENMPDWGVFCGTKIREAEGSQSRQGGQV